MSRSHPWINVISVDIRCNRNAVPWAAERLARTMKLEEHPLFVNNGVPLQLYCSSQLPPPMRTTVCPPPHPTKKNAISIWVSITKEIVLQYEKVKLDYNYENYSYFSCQSVKIPSDLIQ